MAPVRSTVAIAIGVWSKKRMKRTSAARCGSARSSRARLITTVREQPAAGAHREEAAWRVIEILDRVLQVLEVVLLARPVARDVADRPHREALLHARFAERPHPHPQPARRTAVDAGDPHLLLLALAL